MALARGDAQARWSLEGVGVLWRLVAVPGRDRSLPISTLLEPRAAGAWPYGEANAAELREGLS